jgi:3',5'-cyclic AMP phosphodiesterase CpdA
MTREAFVVAQISDIHCGSAYFDGDLLQTAVKETIALEPDLVVIGGDLTSEGYAHEFREALGYLEPLSEAGLNVLVIPGNHDAKNVGYVHFQDAFGAGDVPAKGDRVIHVFGGSPDGDGTRLSVRVVAIDSTKPDVADGEVGRERYGWIRNQFDVDADLRVFVLHHHLVPVPGTGRERNTVWDAGDVLALLDELDVHLVLSGHKHVPHVWLLNEVMIVNSGTACSYRLRGYTRPSYNVLEITRTRIRVTMKYPGTGEVLAAELDRSNLDLHTNPALNAMFDKAAWSV